MTKIVTCPICRTAAHHETRPFCSRRCADIDLGRWFNGTYSIPVQAEAEEKNTEN